MSQKFKDKILSGTGYSNKKFESDYGLKILQKMGWENGKGLGKKENGIQDCIQIRKREENLGLGSSATNVNDTFKWNDNWWEKAFNSAMKSFSDKTPQQSKQANRRKASTTSTEQQPQKQIESTSNFKVIEKKISKKKKKNQQQ